VQRPLEGLTLDEAQKDPEAAEEDPAAHVVERDDGGQEHRLLFQAAARVAQGLGGQHEYGGEGQVDEP
jgi:hypothetical protein